jgi:soluble lytic murein transglycosylase-like protein
MNAVQRAVFPAILIGSLVVVCIGMLAGAAWRLGDAQAVQAASRDVQPGTTDLAEPETAASEAGCEWGKAYPEQVTRWCGLIEQAAVETGLEPALLAALMLEESGGNPDATSKDGAIGLLQVMPRDGIAEAFQCPNGPCFAARPSSAELADPVFNVHFGAKYLAGLVKRVGSLREALKLYGPIGVDYAYADAVLGIQARYQ